MNGKISVKEAAARWGLTERRVSGLCAEGKIPGAEKVGKSWKIPENAKSPSGGAERTQKLPLPVGISDFKRATEEYFYVDKTLMLRDFLDERPAVSLFTRPRRFGKSLNMDMLKVFFEKTAEDTSRYFRDKKIWACGDFYRSYQGKYPVVYLTFKDIKKKNFESTVAAIASLIAAEYARHGEIADGLAPGDAAYYKTVLYERADENQLEQSLGRLTKMLGEHYNTRCVVIIDEYDTPIEGGYSGGFYDEVVAFMRNLLSGALKDNNRLEFGFLTGILRIAKESIFSGLNNLSVNSVCDSKYGEYFGFTRSEVENIAEYYGKTDKIPEICEWYDGYRYGNTEIFNPWSVVCYFSNNCEPRAYWTSTAGNDLISGVLSRCGDDVRKKLMTLVCGGSVTAFAEVTAPYPQITQNPSSVFGLLLASGYLNSVRTTLTETGECLRELRLPNKEIRIVYRSEILQSLEKVIPQSRVLETEEAVFSGDGQRLRSVIRDILQYSASSFDTSSESFYHGLMLGICALLGSAFTTSNRESGDGRYDIALEPKNAALPGIIIELKAASDARPKELKALSEKALRQIADKNYDTQMRLHGIKTIYKYGVAFSGKSVEVSAGE